MPKVLRILNRFNLGGPTYNAVYLTRYLAPEFETLLIGGEKEPSEESSLFIAHDNGLNPQVIPEMKRSINPLADLKAQKKIQEIIADFKPDIVHTHASKAGVLGRRAAFKMKVPITVHTFHGHVFHSYFGSFKTALIKRVERSLAARTSAIVAISRQQQYELTELHRVCPPEKMHVIPLGFDLGKFHTAIAEKRKTFRQKYGVQDDEVVVTIVGRLVPVKNHEFFLQVVDRVLKKTSKKLRFFIVGDGESRTAILDQLQKLQIAHAYWPQEQRRAVVTLTSWSREVDVVNAGADIVVLTSLNEGTPVSLIEAQASGKPIVSTRTGGINDIVLENRSAWLTGVEEVDLFTQKLLHLIENENDRLVMGQAGQQFALDTFGHLVLCQRMRELYHSLLSAGR